MGGGGRGPVPQAAVPVPSAADEEAAAERARLYSLLRSRRGASGLRYGARPNISLLKTKKSDVPPNSVGMVDLWSPYDNTSGGGDGDPGDGKKGGDNDSPGGGTEI